MGERPTLMTQEECDRLEAAEGIVYVAWEAYDRWLKVWRYDHPEDDRDELELTCVYAAACDAARA